MNRKFTLTFSVLTLSAVLFVTLLTAIGQYLLAISYLTFCAFVSYFLYLKQVKKVKPKYPLVFPGPEQDLYFPRSSIPRPIQKDYREHPEYFEKRKKKQSRT